MAKHEFELKPFEVPDFATVELPPAPRQDGMRALPTLAVSELSQEALDDLVEQWIAELYQKAGKPSFWDMPRPIGVK